MPNLPVGFVTAFRFPPVMTDTDEAPGGSSSALHRPVADRQTRAAREVAVGATPRWGPS
jgi:hypothetical protein